MSDEVTPPVPPRGEYREAARSPHWPEPLRALLRFYLPAKGEKLKPCPACGSKSRKRWTMLCPFRVYTFGFVTTQIAGTYDPLILVCSEHPINPTEAILKAL